MIMMLEIVVGSFIIGAFIFGAILILIYLLRWLLYETTGVERKPRAERPLDKEESFGHPDVGGISVDGSTAAPKPSAKQPETKKADEEKPLSGPPKPKYNVVDEFIIDDSDSE